LIFLFRNIIILLAYFPKAHSFPRYPFLLSKLDQFFSWRYVTTVPILPILGNPRRNGCLTNQPHERSCFRASCEGHRCTRRFCKKASRCWCVDSMWES